ncbi:V-type proton ATPase 116 kDa subunit a 1-like [Amyelois transitella]|uniref:V-type proton ATPase 116 kDa subunit a 1-like n=1 Tax=Amyelois transitella TaxID=680683 RepID=UPI0029902294|nr:V-type proton ATPase 116 kDa subunit a 1-like [Amyelois transitella]
MGCMLRSDFMTLFDLYLQPETAFKILAYLGEVGCVQFLDMNQNVQAFRRCYVSEICRCSEIERILRYMEDEMKKHNIPPGRSRFDPKPLMPNEMLPLENMLEKWESELLELSANNANLLKLYSEMTEMHYVLDSVEPMLGDAEIRNEDITRDLQGKGGQLMLVTGVVRRVRSYAFQMMLWRISLGNIYYRQAQEDRIFKDASGQEERKVAFLVICQGDRLHDRVLKICSGFRANLYPCPRTADDRHVMNKDIGIKLEDQKVVLAKTRYQRCKALYTVAQQWGTWKMRVKKTKAIYHTMNLFNLDITRKCLIGRCWVPDADVHKVQRCLKYYSDKLETPVESFLIKSSANEKPPTFHRTNKFTHGFQALINAYGESYYRELNPALYTVITFPFLFAVMFGDLGHGLILVVSATWMIVKERKIMALRSNNEIFNIAFNGRYVILMLGLFTIVTGFIYNDVFSRGLRLMDPYWINNKTKADIRSKHFITLNPSGSTGKYPYFFGMDPVWKDATNKIVIENSFKMKMSIILGVVHMLFGLCLAFFNNIYFKKYCYIFLEVIPSVLILCSIFLWMVFLIYAKWIYFDPKSTDPDRNPACAQLILILIIDLVLVGKTDKKVPEGCSSFFIFGEAQRIIHRVLLVVLIICIPILLFGVPIYKRRKYTKALMAASASSQGSKFRKYRQSVIQKEEARLARQSGVPAFNFGEVMIRQAIHTVEYTLSTVSHTASYLRLWALSLAHSQLAEMLWEMILSEIGLRSCLTGGSFVGTLTLFFIFALWAFFTMSILVIMEGMSAFLHTLRLHWVEFMSKFYHGNGWMFTPFSFASILAEGDTIDAVCNKKKI